MAAQSQMPVALLGAGACPASHAQAISRRAELRLSLDEPGVIAAVVAASAHDPFKHAQEALLAGIPVLYAAPFHLSPWQASVLEELSSRKKLILRFVEPFRYQPGYSFLQRLLEGREPFWRPLYVRSLYSMRPQAHARLDDLATEEMALYDSLLDVEPLRVSAVAVHCNETAQVCAASITVEYDGGPPLHSMVSVAEASNVHQLVAVASERTVVLDQVDDRVPLRIVGAGSEGHDVSFGGENNNPEQGEPFAQELDGFLTAIDARDLSFGNGIRWSRVAATWWAARQSMSCGGSVDVSSVQRKTNPPPLTVIEGGGRSSGTAGRRPVLTVVGG